MAQKTDRSAWSIVDWQKEVVSLFTHQAEEGDITKLFTHIIQTVCRIPQSYRLYPRRIPSDLAELTVLLLILTHRVGVDLDLAMAQKWPGACIYCGKVVDCGCIDQPHGDAVISEARLELLGRPLAVWQAGLRQTFHAGNVERGFQEAMFHLLDEVLREVNKCLLVLSEPPLDSPRIEEVRAELKLECADVLAWTIALANLRDVDLNTLLHRRYRRGCPACRGRPCTVKEWGCPAYYSSPRPYPPAFP